MTVYDQKKEETNAEIVKFKAELQKKAKNIAPVYMKRYLELKTSSTAPVVKFTGGRCMGCHMELPNVYTKRVSESDAPVECENCGRILYMCE